MYVKIYAGLNYTFRVTQKMNKIEKQQSQWNENNDNEFIACFLVIVG